MENLPQSAEELTQWLFGFLPEGLRPFAGFALTVLIVGVGVLTFFQPVIEMFRKKDQGTPSTGDATLDALLALDASGKLKSTDRDTLTAALLARVSKSDTTQTSSSAGAETREQKLVVQQIIAAPASPQKTERLSKLLVNPTGAIDDMMNEALTPEEYLDIGRLASGFDAVRARAAYARAAELAPDNLDAAYQLIRTDIQTGEADAISRLAALLPRVEGKRPDLTSRILTRLAVEDSFSGQKEAAYHKFERSIEIAQSNNQTEALAIALGSYADALSTEERLDEAEQMLQRADEVLEKSDTYYPYLHVTNQLSLSEIAFQRNDFVQSETHAREAYDIAHKAGTKDREADCLSRLSLALEYQDRVSESLDAIEEAIELTASVYKDSDFPNAANFIQKASLLMKLGRYDEALPYFERARPCYEIYDHDAHFLEMIDQLIDQCKAGGVVEDDTDEPDTNTDADEDSSPPAFDLEARLAQSEQDLEDGLLDENTDVESVFSADEEEKLQRGSMLYAEGCSRFENEDYSNAIFALETAKKLLNEIDSLDSETEGEIDRMLKISRSKLS